MTVGPLHSLPLGFRFHPKDEELVNYYLKGKITGKIKSGEGVIPEIDVCKCEPWDLPEKSLIKSDDPEWFFFAPKDRKYPNGGKANRQTKIGYWKATGKDRVIRSSAGRGSIIGMKRTLVFHQGRAPKGVRTNWIMHEYRTTEPEFESGDQGGYILCRLFDKTPEDKTSSFNTTEPDMEIRNFSSDDTQHLTNVIDEIEIQSNHGSPKSDSQEELISLPHPAEKQQGKGDCSTGISVKPELNYCNLISPDEVTKMGEKDVLTQISGTNYDRMGHNVPNVGSSLLQPCDDNQRFHIAHPAEYIFDDLDMLLNTIDFDDCSWNAYLSPKESSPDSLLKHSPFNSVSCKDSGASSDIETEPFLTQDTADLEISQWFQRSPLMSPDSLQMDGFVYSERTHLNTLNENANMLQCSMTVPDVYSVKSGMESLEDDLFNILEEPDNQNTISDKGEDFERTGIKIRSREMQQLGLDSENVVLQQGTAGRRIRLQGSIRKVAVSSVGGQYGGATNGSKTSPTKATQILSNSVEELTSQKTTIDETDNHVETEIKIEARDIQPSSDMFALKDNISRKFIYQRKLEETLKAEENVSDNTSEAGENTASTSLDNLREISNNDADETVSDADETPSCSSMQQESESVLRLRKKPTNESGKELKHSHSIPREPRARHARSSAIYLVLSVVFVLIYLVGMWMRI